MEWKLSASGVADVAVYTCFSLGSSNL